jgi:hypothetical protein
MLQYFVKIGQHYDLWVPKSKSLGYSTSSGSSFNTGVGSCTKCYTKDEKYILYIKGIVVLSMAAASVIYAFFYYLIAVRWKWIQCSGEDEESPTKIRNLSFAAQKKKEKKIPLLRYLMYHTMLN